MGEAIRIRESSEKRLKIDAAIASVASGELWQMPDGKAAYMEGLNAAAANDQAGFRSDGVVKLPKTTGIVLLDGGDAYWDHSANKIHFKKVNDRDFYAGRIVGDQASAATTVNVDLNADSRNDRDLLRDACLSVPVGTQAVGGFGFPKILGGAQSLELTATNEAQKIDLLGVDGFDPTANPIIEFTIRVPDGDAAGAGDLNVGVANGTHATDFDSTTEHLSFHIDGNSTNINAQSKTSGLTNAAADTTKDIVVGSAVANRAECWIDLRDPTDAHLYVEGVEVLAATTWNMSAAVGPLFLIAHLEKTSSTDTMRFIVDKARARFMQQDGPQR